MSAMNFPLNIALVVSHKFWCVYFHCILFPFNLPFDPWVSYIKVHCLVSRCFEILNLLQFVLWLMIWSILKYVLWSLLKWMFSATENVLVFSLFLRDICRVWNNLFLICFTIYNELLCFFLVSMVSDEISAVTQIVFLFYVHCYFSWAAFKIFFFCHFQKFDSNCLDIYLSRFMCMNFAQQIWDIFSHYFFEYRYSPTLSLPWDPTDENVPSFKSHRFLFLVNFDLCGLHWVISSITVF